MRELTIELPLSGPAAQYLIELLKHSTSISFAKARAKGLRLICHVPSSASRLLIDSIAADESSRIQLVVLDSDGSTDLLQISAGWEALISGEGRTDNILRMIRSAARKPIYITSDPVFRRGMLRISFVAEEKTILNLKKEIERFDSPIKVVRLAPSRGTEITPLSDLTARQASILRLAYSMGYYDVPKRARVEDIARKLGMDKGTVGEHLRRAEKHVFDRLLT